MTKQTCCDGTGWTGNPYERCVDHYEVNDLSEFYSDVDYD